MEAKAILNGSIVELDLLHGEPTVEHNITLLELVELREKTIARLKSYMGTLLGLQSYSLDSFKTLITKINKLQMNSAIIKQAIAIANVGLPDQGYFGINGSIYQSSDLKQLNVAMLNLKAKIKGDPSKETQEVVSFIEEESDVYMEIIKKHRQDQTLYNKKFRVQLKLYNI